MATAILKATDLAATIDWYTSIGFELRGRLPESGSPTWCELGRDDTTLQFLAGATPWNGPPAFTGTFYVHPPSVTVLYDQIKERATVEWGPEVREWGQREVGRRDPNGYFITFTEAVGDRS